MRALVTGGAGFVGTNLIKRLLKDGYEVTSLDNYSTGKKENEQEGCVYHKVNLSETRIEKIKNFTERPDVIFHLAAKARITPSIENPTETLFNNLNSTIRVLDYARGYYNSQVNIPVIYAGSSSAHGDLYANPYTFSKWSGEELCKLYSDVYDIPTSIMRFYNVYGPHHLIDGPYCTVVGIFQEQYMTAKPLTITGDGTQRRDFTHVTDIVDALYRCMEAMHGAVDMRYAGAEFELGRGVNFSINELADMFGDVPKNYIPARKGEYDITLCTDKTAHEVLGWNPTINIDDYIKDFVDTQGFLDE